MAAPSMPPAHRCFAAGAPLGLAMALLLGIAAAASAAPALPRVVEVPSRPAFTKPPGGSEDLARPGQVLATRSLLRTQKPGRMQVQLANGRSFRLGGDAVARLGADGLDLESGQIIAWVNPGSKGSGSPLQIRTRVGTASIMGTTVFIDSTPEAVKVFSWEGHVTVTADAGQRFELHSGEQVVFEQGAWLPPRRLSLEEATARRTQSILLNGFDNPMETLPVIERELGLKRVPANAVSPSPR